MVFIVDAKDPPLRILGVQFRFEQSTNIAQGHPTPACQNSQCQIGSVLQFFQNGLDLGRPQPREERNLVDDLDKALSSIFAHGSPAGDRRAE